MKKLLITILAAFILEGAHAQTEAHALKYAETITGDDLHEYLSILASDALEGRETGERGQKMAAALISEHFEELGLIAPVKIGPIKSYYQPIELYSSVPGETYIKTDEKKYDNFEKVIYYGKNSTGKEVSREIVFAGDGTAESFAQVDAVGNAALVMIDNVEGSRAVAETAEKNGVEILFIVPTQDEAKFAELSDQFENWLSGGRLSLQTPKVDNPTTGMFFISPTIAGELFDTPLDKLIKITEDPDKLKKIKPVTVSYKTTQKVEIVDTENVLGYLEGTDKKDELLVITAHYDHEGIKGGKIYNGADDDGSGTSAVMELAEAFALASENGLRPRRSILFMTVTAEEKGLLGSAYYTANPVFPLENTIANLNIDMIGRVDPEHEGDPNYVYLVGSDRLSTELHEISERVNETFTQLELDYTYNDEDHPDRIYYRSDHWNFAKNNIPVIFYFNGVHEDYHKPTDTVEKINFKILTKRTKLIFYTAWALANRDERPVVDKIQE